MNKLNMRTRGIVDENVRKISVLFPNCLTEIKDKEGHIVHGIDFDILRQELSGRLVEGYEERYHIDWPDKREAILLANRPTTNTLRPCRQESVNFDTTQNIYIEGENLEILKVIRETYLGKVKIIYIDPPYNTGNDFVYNDDFAQDTDEYKDNSGQLDEEGNRLVQNTESNGRFHTDWLNMIYPRLKVAKDLLSDDGVIFISIDDNEIENLQKICSEIFGESNRVAKVIVNRPSEIATDLTIQKHEYCLVYSKNIQSIKLCGNKKTTISRGTVGNVDQTMPIITFPIGLRCLNIPDGTYTQSRQINGSMENIEVITPFIVENSCLKEPTQLKARWRSSNDMRNFFANNCRPTKAKINGIIEEIYFDGDRFMPYIKKSVTEKLPTIYLENKRGSTDLEHLNINYFDFPKSVSYIAFLISLFTEGPDVVLDFFSGSSTTAHAVMQLNAEDGGNRKFIMVQLPEKTDEKSEAYKAGYKNICEIGKERIRRAGKKIKEENADKEGIDKLDTGFRVLKLDSSNMQDVYYTPKEFTERELFADNVKPDRTAEDLLFQAMLELGVELSATIEQRTIDGKQVFFVNDNYLVACFDENIAESTITKIAQMKPYYFVMRDSSLASDNVADNFDQLFETYSKDTTRKII